MTFRGALAVFAAQGGEEGEKYNAARMALGHEMYDILFDTCA